MKAYRPRETWIIGVRKFGEWQMKVYGIATSRSKLETTTVEAALTFAEKNVAWPGRRNFRLGFVTIHVGEEGIWLLVDQWFDDILHHFLFRAPVEDPVNFAAVEGGTMACVWELEVTRHERDAWVEHVLSKPENADFSGYLGDALAISAECVSKTAPGNVVGQSGRPTI